MTHSATSFDVEAFGSLHPDMDPSIATYARAALASCGASPRSVRALRDGVEHIASVSFSPPDKRMENTFERQRVVEFGAIVLAGLLLAGWEGKRITRVTKRGTHVDYFVGEQTGDERWILEVGGTDDGSHQAKRTEKRKQLERSLYRRAPFNKDGFVAVSRFSEPGVTSLDAVAAAQ